MPTKLSLVNRQNRVFYLFLQEREARLAEKQITLPPCPSIARESEGGCEISHNKSFCVLIDLFGKSFLLQFPILGCHWSQVSQNDSHRTCSTPSNHFTHFPCLAQESEISPRKDFPKRSIVFCGELYYKVRKTSNPTPLIGVDVFVPIQGKHFDNFIGKQIWRLL